MTFIIWVLTAAMVLNCVLLIFLVLIQLPKKDAGAGMAFGGGAGDALFGAGAGNALTNITKWATGFFFALAIVLAILNNKVHAKKSDVKILPDYNQPAQSVPAATPAKADGLLAFPAAKADAPVKVEAPATPETPAAK